MSGDPFGVLKRVLSPRPRPRPGEACEMCAEPIGAEHSHVASLRERRLLCTCRACYLLFTSGGAGASRLRAVPDRVVLARDFAFTEQQWDELAIPVDLVFFLKQSDPEDPDAAPHVVACYPSPAGATESELDLAHWAQLAGHNPTLATVQDDVEGILVRRTGEGTFTCLIVPIDACYELVGLVKKYWSGFQGGAEVWQHIDGFFNSLLSRARGTGELGNGERASA